MANLIESAQPCPFCGTTALVFDRFDRGESICHSVRCHCGATGPVAKMYGCTNAEHQENREKALELWNRRAT